MLTNTYTSYKMIKPLVAIPVIVSPEHMSDPRVVQALNNEIRDYKITSLIENDEYYLIIKFADRNMFFNRAWNEKVTMYVNANQATRDEIDMSITLRLSKEAFYDLREMSKQMPDVNITRLEK